MSAEPFHLEEATIDAIHAAFRSEALTCRRLVELYLARIAAYDRQGPTINAIVTVNPHVAEDADVLDRAFSQSGQLTGPLHGIPVLVKDQCETEDIPTTYGSVAFKGQLPAHDATVVKKLRGAGAIILAKTSLPDFATSWFSFSSVTGETRNPYALERDPGGSSSGTGAAVAANLGAVGIGEDTGGSIRVPASFNNLVGVRVTTGLISRNGLSPLVVFQDTAGPMTRTVRDAARLLDVLVGYDPADPFTVAALNTGLTGSYQDKLSDEGLQGARIGLVREAFGASDDPEGQQINALMEQAGRTMRGLGAELVDPVTIPGLQDFIVRTSLYLQQSKHDINAFLASRAGAHTVEELYQTRQFHPMLDLFAGIAQGPAHPEDDPAYFPGLAARGMFQRAILNVLASHRLDALLYPDVRVLPPRREELHSGRWTTLTFPTNTLIAPQADLPAVSVPAGFTEDGIPVGLELVGKPYAEPTLLRLAYAYGQRARHRRPPRSTPPLPEESR